MRLNILSYSGESVLDLCEIPYYATNLRLSIKLYINSLIKSKSIFIVILF